MTTRQGLPKIEGAQLYRIVSALSLADCGTFSVIYANFGQSISPKWVLGSALCEIRYFQRPLRASR